jgi:hypothetical protein
MERLSRGRLFLIAGLLMLLFSFRISAQCPVPTNLHISNLTPTSGLFLWNNSYNSTEYVLKVRPTGTSIWRRITSGNNSETVTGLIPNTNYEAKVRSDCSGIEGDYSSHFYFTTPSNNPCNLPNVYYFTSNNITANSCKVGWRAVSGATGYNVHWRIRYSNQPWIEELANTNSLVLNGLTPHTQYEFEVQTVCSAGSAPYSSFGIFTTLNSLCNPPSGLAVSNVTDSTADLLWSPVSCAAYYSIAYSIDGQTWITDTTSQTSLHITGLTAGSSYEFKVLSAIAAGGLTGFSQVYSFATSNSSCGEPVNLTTTTVNTSGATLTWDNVSGALSYNVRYRLAGASTWQSVSAISNSATIAGLTPDNAYDFQVQSICSSGNGSFSATATFITDANPPSASIPVPDHIVVVIMENKAYSQIFGGSLTPRINALGADPKSAVFTESYGKTHPSQPNYLHIFSGTNQGISNNGLITQKFTTPNLAAELINAGFSFASYADGMPSTGFDGESSGRYHRRHNPVTNWMGTGTNQVPATTNKPFTSFPTDFNNLPTVSFVIPDLDHDMHDGALGTALANGDNWFYNNLNAYVQWAKTHNSLFIMTTDEDDGSHSNRVLTIFNGQMVAGGVYSQPITHHNVLRTICEMYGLNFIGGAAQSAPIRGCWTNGFRQAGPVENTESITEDKSGWNVYPNPSRGELHIAYELEQDANVTIKIFSSTGGLVHERKFGEISKGKRVYDLPSDVRLSAGAYFVSVEYGDKKNVQRFLVSE